MIKISIRHKEVNFIIVDLVAYSKPFSATGGILSSGFSAISLYNFKAELLITNMENAKEHLVSISTELIFINYLKKQVEIPVAGFCFVHYFGYYLNLKLKSI